MLTYYDDFNRADANPIGGDWVTVPGFSALRIVSNQAIGATAAVDCGSYLAPSAGGPDQFCEVVLGATNIDAGPCLRHQLTALCNCYVYAIQTDEIAKFVDNSFTTIDTVAVTWVSGDRCRFSIVGSLLRVHQNGILRHSFTDTTFRSGPVGIFCFDNNGNVIEGVMCGYYDALSTGV